MDSADEGTARVTLPEVRSLYNLLKVTEELLFSFPLSADLVRKYEMVREGAFGKAGLIHSASKLRRMQKEAHARQRLTVSPKETQTDNRPVTPPPVSPDISALKFSELDSRANVLRFEFLSRLESSHDIVRQYQQLLNFMLSSLTNEANRFSELIDQGVAIKYPPIRITDINPGVDILPEKELSIEELELEQPRVMQWFMRLEEEHKLHLEAFKEDFNDRNAKFSLLLQQIAEKYQEQDECIQGLENELKSVNEHSTEVIDELKTHLDSLTQEMERNKQQKEREMKDFKADLERQTEKSLVETRRNFENELKKLASEKEKSIKSISETEKAVLNTKMTSLDEIEGLRRQHNREMEETRGKWEESLEKERRQHRRELAAKEDELMEKEREWKGLRKRLEEEVARGKVQVQVTAVASEMKAVQTLSESTHHSLQGPLTQLLPELHSRLFPFYLKHSSADKGWNQTLPRRREDLHARLKSLAEHVELVLAADFAVYLGGKLTTDNAWLVERLTEFGKENEKLRLAVSAPQKSTTVYLSPSKPAGKLHKQVWEDIRATAATLRDFEEARDELLRKLQGSR